MSFSSKSENTGSCLARIELALGHRVDRQPSKWVGHDDGRVGLDVALMNEPRAVGALDDFIGRGETGLHIATGKLHGIRDVVGVDTDVGRVRSASNRGMGFAFGPIHVTAILGGLPARLSPSP